VLTDQGRALLVDARAVAGDVDLFKARAKSLAGGLEPELSVAVGRCISARAVHRYCGRLPAGIPATLLRFDVESSAVIEPVLDGRCGVGVIASLRVAPPQLTRERLLAGQDADSRFAAAPAGRHRVTDSDGRPRRAHPTRTRRSFGSIASRWIRVVISQGVASFPSGGQACFPARRTWVWHHAGFT